LSKSYKFKKGDKVWFICHDDMIRGATVLRVMSPPTLTRDTLYELSYGYGVEEKWLVKIGDDAELDDAMQVVADRYADLDSTVKSPMLGILMP
jgi:hypothetical protein